LLSVPRVRFASPWAPSKIEIMVVGRCKRGRGGPRDGRPGGRRYRGAIFIPGCEPKDHERLFSGILTGCAAFAGGNQWVGRRCAEMAGVGPDRKLIPMCETMSALASYRFPHPRSPKARDRGHPHCGSDRAAGPGGIRQFGKIVNAIRFLGTGTPLLILFYWTITCRAALWVRAPEVAVTVIV
jgi:hypothetical protein